MPAGGDLQAAIDDAKPGDAIALEPGATYTGPFRLPRKDGDGWIVIAPRAERGLPPPGQRVTPSDARAMSKLVASSGDAVIEADAGAHHYRLVGLEIAPADGVFLRALVHLGANETDAASQPHHVIIDRCYLHGDPRKGTRRGIALNARDSAVVNSYLSDFKEVGADSQAIAGWNGAGPFKIANNYLEAAGENVMFGGADPSIPDLVPADIEITGNHFAKPLRWKEGDSAFEGTAWTVKNLFELKNARRVLVDGNLLEYNWPHGQNGFAILFTPRNQDGGAPWSVVEDVTFANNVVRHVAAGHQHARPRRHPQKPADETHRHSQQRVSRRRRPLGPGPAVSAARRHRGRDHRAQHGGQYRRDHVGRRSHARTRASCSRTTSCVDNNARHRAGGTGAGRPTLDRYFPGAVVRRNAIVGGSADRYPADNFFPASLDQVGFVGAQASNVRLAASSPYKRAGTDKRDLGADVEALHPLTSSRHLGRSRQLRGPTRWLLRCSCRAVLVVVLLLAYVYAGYPLVAWLRATLRPKSHDTAAWEPTVTVVVVAHNEQDRIAARLENLLALDYPREKLEIRAGLGRIDRRDGGARARLRIGRRRRAAPSGAGAGSRPC